MQRGNYQERTLGELFADLSRESSALVRQEVRLAKSELSQKVSHLAKDAGMLVAGGALAYAGFLAILAALIIALGGMMPMWLSALLVGIVVTGIGYLMIQKGRDALTKADLMPRETIETLKEDKEWVQAQTR